MGLVPVEVRPLERHAGGVTHQAGRAKGAVPCDRRQVGVCDVQEAIEATLLDDGSVRWALAPRGQGFGRQARLRPRKKSTPRWVTGLTVTRLVNGCPAWRVQGRGHCRGPREMRVPCGQITLV